MERFRRFLFWLLIGCLMCCAAAGGEDALPAETPLPIQSTLASGATGDEVRALQARLAELGYYGGELDGDYGGGTKKAVRAFQKQCGLDADGIAGPKTIAALFAEDAPQAPAPPEPVDVLAGELPMLVNRTHPVSEDFLPADLVTLTSCVDSGLVKIKYKQTRAVQTAVDALIRMLEAAREEGVTKWQISAAYRSWENQEQLLNAKINSYLSRNEGWSRSRARSAALNTVAKPGESEHHLGLAFDINVPGSSAFLGTKQCTWLHRNCWRFGFIVRYPAGKEKITGYAAEAWHIRYVGVSHALYMQEHDLVLEEYLEGIENGTISVPLPAEEEDILLD